ncbi:102aa long hypothetical protein [Pyrococcus horikoshii OT3]|uniref:Uncharacterized protein n=1 Tax=Pyrococcus horikoshii (strain ATCC 700860 / DSM 12428 / JCM 9974 / NBRC 100139 / OT-3) TaxID=70601 RepID=O59332_PYRHO|nr:102aa long hypothetical protein [Pyrococcus horikoshii OT3]
MPTNRIGAFITWLILKAAPPLASASSFVNITPSIFTAWLNCLACSTIAFPAKESPTKITRLGFVTLAIFFISSIRFLLVSLLPAVSIKTTSIPLALACWIAS